MLNIYVSKWACYTPLCINMLLCVYGVYFSIWTKWKQLCILSATSPALYIIHMLADPDKFIYSSKHSGLESVNSSAGKEGVSAHSLYF